MFDAYKQDSIDWDRDFGDCGFNSCCNHFKNKADFVEVETIKSWLYEIAMNNVGVAFDGDFSKACEDIISRLDGLKWYAIEKG
jgi:hypothetical protein